MIKLILILFIYSMFSYAGSEYLIEWEKPPLKNDDSYVLEISRTKSFKNILLKKEVFGESFKWRINDPGDFYWRISYFEKESNKRIKSEIAHIGIDAKIAEFEKNEKEIKIDKEVDTTQKIKWSSSSVVDNFIFEISTNPKFKESVKTKLQKNEIEIILKPNVQYFFRVHSLTSDMNFLNYSSIEKIKTVYNPPPKKIKFIEKNFHFFRSKEKIPIVIGTKKSDHTLKAYKLINGKFKLLKKFESHTGTVKIKLTNNSDYKFEVLNSNNQIEREIITRTHSHYKYDISAALGYLNLSTDQASSALSNEGVADTQSGLISFDFMGWPKVAKERYGYHFNLDAIFVGGSEVNEDLDFTSFFMKRMSGHVIVEDLITKKLDGLPRRIQLGFGLGFRLNELFILKSNGTKVEHEIQSDFLKSMIFYTRFNLMKDIKAKFSIELADKLTSLFCMNYTAMRAIAVKPIPFKLFKTFFSGDVYAGLELKYAVGKKDEVKDDVTEVTQSETSLGMLIGWRI